MQIEIGMLYVSFLNLITQFEQQPRKCVVSSQSRNQFKMLILTKKEVKAEAEADADARKKYEK